MSAPHLRRPADSELRREWSEVGENELRLDPEAAAVVIEDVNRCLSGLYILFNQLRKHYWTVEGAEFRQVEQRLRDRADRLSDLTDDLAIRVHALGGVPVNGPMGIREHAPMQIEAGDVYGVRDALANDLDGYATLAVVFREAIETALEVGDERTVETLQEGLLAIEQDAHAVERYLGDDSL
ncbi:MULTISPECIES: ferritin-like domain-containing protein [Halolamina]|uniref:DNA-binding ferritin-like protein (Oxidative damage protectant) n=1 Tax=Halolamina pelagica TaxID=699431 RepID=A0A1I5LZJ1_9EURY|nr:MULTISPECIES: ferritin-like domain-containing protein [Halolamina]NHX35782.1 DNA starvation/stationary phase protection protein [Halolamina sp. R1-12]SFP02583.1 DNA-binding ferritin-like protein (oxidative damage protectant) [Halolamina pelagica]